MSICAKLTWECFLTTPIDYGKIKRSCRKHKEHQGDNGEKQLKKVETEIGIQVNTGLDPSACDLVV